MTPQDKDIKGAGMGGKRRRRRGMGPGGNCICPNCGEILVHKRGLPCFEMKCPKCGTPMIRE